MRGTYRFKLLARAIRFRWLQFKANRAIARFPTIHNRLAHNLTAPLIVTLTSYPPRFPNLARTLKSLLDQSVRPDRTVLWIAEGDIAALPAEVLTLQQFGLEIRTTHDIRSYKKLIPALELWTDAIFVTADDDVYYPANWLEGLVTTALLNPKDVIAGRMHIAPIDADGNFRKYADWSLASHLEIAPTSQTRVFPTGVGGVLYPPNAFHQLVTDRDLFIRLAPNGDDIWFFWMARMAGTQQRRVDQWFDIIEWPSSQQVALCTDNLLGDGNDRQLRAMTEHFGPVP